MATAERGAGWAWLEPLADPQHGCVLLVSLRAQGRWGCTAKGYTAACIVVFLRDVVREGWVGGGGLPGRLPWGGGSCREPAGQHHVSLLVMARLAGCGRRRDGTIAWWVNGPPPVSVRPRPWARTGEAGRGEPEELVDTDVGNVLCSALLIRPSGSGGARAWQLCVCMTRVGLRPYLLRRRV